MEEEAEVEGEEEEDEDEEEEEKTEEEIEGEEDAVKVDFCEGCVQMDTGIVSVLRASFL